MENLDYNKYYRFTLLIKHTYMGNDNNRFISISEHTYTVYSSGNIFHSISNGCKILYNIPSLSISVNIINNNSISFRTFNDPNCISIRSNITIEEI